jgi:integrase/recombinase XerD
MRLSLCSFSIICSGAAEFQLDWDRRGGQAGPRRYAGTCPPGRDAAAVPARYHQAMDYRAALDRYCAYLLTARGRARATVANYRRDLEQFAELAGMRDLVQVDRDATLRWLDALSGLQLAPRSLARKLSAVRGFTAWAVEYGLLERDPVPREASSPRSFKLPHALTEGEMLALLRAADGIDPAGIRDRAILEVLYASGMRVSELCGLRLDALQLGEGFAIVLGKGAKQRLTPLGQCALLALRMYLDGPRAQLCAQAERHPEVFLSQRGPLSRSQVFRLVKKYAALAGVAKVSPHTFRHSCASHLLAHGADLRLVQELLGHASLSTTQIYTHIEKSRLRSVYDQAHPLA